MATAGRGGDDAHARTWELRRQLAPLAVLLVVVGAVIGVAALRQRADGGRRAELLLVRLDGLTQEQYAQLGRAVAERRADDDLLAAVRTSREQFDATLTTLVDLDATGRPGGLDARVAAFRSASDDALRMLAGGQPSLAADRVQSDVGVSARALLDQLHTAAAESGDRADRLARGGDIGSLVLLLVAGSIVWLLLRQAGKARRDADSASAQVANQERFRSLVQHSSDVITVTDAAGSIIYQSPSVTPVFGYDADEMVGTELQRLVHPDDVRPVIAALVETARVSGAERIECRVRHADGTWRHVESAVSARLDDPTVRGIVLNSRDITERKELEEQLAHQAFHDSLTGLANRALFRNRIEHALARTRRQPRPIAVLLLDLDGFKTINDSLGHAFGDTVLVAVAERLREHLRPSDTACRLGGDEFAILAEDLTEGGGAAAVAERILHALRIPFVVEDKELVLTPSIGYTVAGAEQTDADDLLRNADVAMYTAKGRGRNRCELFQPSMHQAMLDRMDLEADLRRAIDGGEFVLNYQPTVALATGWISGVEALLRWPSPGRGMVPPSVFIPVAEDTGLIVKLGAWVLEEACRQAVAWKEAFGADAPRTMNVNLSARQLQDDDLVASVAAILERTGVRPEHVVLEITESAVMADAEAMIARLYELKALGVRLAIDDFGTGYSSMSYLCKFPIDVLKIDRSFVSGVGNDPQKVGIVRTIVELGRILDLQTVAEGIELVEELEELLALECELGQGYWFARPLSVEAAGAMLIEQSTRRRRGEFVLVPTPLPAAEAAPFAAG
ncbi:MAG TPA: EAL domain-containing protein [Acidimicrobiales bacterium]|nr:EAL domain-containing protein [Acidimicrobiales bacterium]